MFPGEGRELELPFQEGESLLEILRRGGVMISAPCGGSGRCGKCAVRVTRGSLPVTEDRRFFSEEELNRGMRLACCARPQGTLYVEPAGKAEKDFDVVGETVSRKAGDTSYGIAVDLGTTTLALALVGRQSQEVKAAWAGVNPQRSYGADVIARIHAAAEGRAETLQEVIRQALRKGIQALLTDAEQKRAGGADGDQREYNDAAFADGISLRDPGGPRRLRPMIFSFTS